MDTLREILTENPVRIGFAVVATGVFYAHIVLLTRLSGKRSLAQMTTFDFLTNVSIGSILPAAIVTRGIAFWTGLAVLTTLIALQWAVTWLVTRSPRVQDVISAPPRLLVYDGRPLHDAMRRERITEEQLRAKLREQGFGRLENAAAVVLETSGVVSVLASGDRIADAMLDGVASVPPDHRPGEAHAGQHADRPSTRTAHTGG